MREYQRVLSSLRGVWINGGTTISFSQLCGRANLSEQRCRHFVELLRKARCIEYDKLNQLSILLPTCYIPRTIKDLKSHATKMARRGRESRDSGDGESEDELQDDLDSKNTNDAKDALSVTKRIDSSIDLSLDTNSKSYQDVIKANIRFFDCMTLLYSACRKLLLRVFPRNEVIDMDLVVLLYTLNASYNDLRFHLLRQTNAMKDQLSKTVNILIESRHKLAHNTDCHMMTPHDIISTHTIISCAFHVLSSFEPSCTQNSDCDFTVEYQRMRDLMMQSIVHITSLIIVNQKAITSRLSRLDVIALHIDEAVCKMQQEEWQNQNNRRCSTCGSNTWNSFDAESGNIVPWSNPQMKESKRAHQTREWSDQNEPRFRFTQNQQESTLNHDYDNKEAKISESWMNQFQRYASSLRSWVSRNQREENHQTGPNHLIYDGQWQNVPQLENSSSQAMESKLQRADSDTQRVSQARMLVSKIMDHAKRTVSWFDGRKRTDQTNSEDSQQESDMSDEEDTENEWDTEKHELEYEDNENAKETGMSVERKSQTDAKITQCDQKSLDKLFGNQRLSTADHIEVASRICRQVLSRSRAIVEEDMQNQFYNNPEEGRQQEENPCKRLSRSGSQGWYEQCKKRDAGKRTSSPGAKNVGIETSLEKFFGRSGSIADVGTRMSNAGVYSSFLGTYQGVDIGTRMSMTGTYDVGVRTSFTGTDVGTHKSVTGAEIGTRMSGPFPDDMGSLYEKEYSAINRNDPSGYQATVSTSHARKSFLEREPGTHQSFTGVNMEKLGPFDVHMSSEEIGRLRDTTRRKTVSGIREVWDNKKHVPTRTPPVGMATTGTRMSEPFTSELGKPTDTRGMVTTIRDTTSPLVFPGTPGKRPMERQKELLVYPDEKLTEENLDKLSYYLQELLFVKSVHLSKKPKEKSKKKNKMTQHLVEINIELQEKNPLFYKLLIKSNVDALARYIGCQLPPSFMPSVLMTGEETGLVRYTMEDEKMKGKMTCMG